MDVSSPNNKKIQERTFRSLKNVLYFRKLNFLAESLKYSYFFSKKKLLDFRNKLAEPEK